MKNKQNNNRKGKLPKIICKVYVFINKNNNNKKEKKYNT